MTIQKYIEFTSKNKRYIHLIVKVYSLVSPQNYVTEIASSSEILALISNMSLEKVGLKKPVSHISLSLLLNLVLLYFV